MRAELVALALGVLMPIELPDVLLLAVLPLVGVLPIELGELALAAADGLAWVRLISTTSPTTAAAATAITAPAVRCSRQLPTAR